jgi:hypothetical protein
VGDDGGDDHVDGDDDDDHFSVAILIQGKHAKRFCFPQCLCLASGLARDLPQPSGSTTRAGGNLATKIIGRNLDAD